MRTFTDQAGAEWTVFEVNRRTSDAPGNWTYLSAGYGDGWLCFEGQHAKRRLTNFPPKWRELPDAELEVLCESAKPAQRSGRLLGLEPPIPPSCKPGGTGEAR